MVSEETPQNAQHRGVQGPSRGVGGQDKGAGQGPDPWRLCSAGTNDLLKSELPAQWGWGLRK